MPPWLWVVIVLIAVAVAIGLLLGNWLASGMPAAKGAARVIGILAVAGTLGGAYGVFRSLNLTWWLSSGLGRSNTDRGIVPYLTHSFHCHEHPNATECPGGINHDPPPPPPPFY